MGLTSAAQFWKRKICRGLGFGLLLAALIPSAVSASGAISQAFTTTDTKLVTGSLVSLVDKHNNVVESATTTSRDQLLGVVGNKTLVELNSGGSEAQIVVTGTAPALVSDINGPVKKGDRLTISPITGVGMKATTAGMVIGTAQQDLASAKSTTSHSVKDKTGDDQTVKVGLVNAQITVAYYAPSEDKLKPLLPSFLLTIGQTIAGKDISGIRVIVSLFVLLLGFLTVTVMLQAGIRSGIISLGRNPLAHKDIRRGLVDVTVTAVVVLLLTVMAMYVILSA